MFYIIKKTNETHYKVFNDQVEEYVNDIQLMGMLRLKIANTETVADILYRLTQIPIGAEFTVPYN